MAKPRSNKEALPSPSRWRGPLVRIGVLALCILFGGAACAGAYYYIRRSVEREYLVYPDVPRVVLKDRPVWMSDFLATEIARTARPMRGRSALDHELLKTVEGVLRQNAWIKQVRQVRRVYGERPGDTIEIDCEYRTPVALVAWGKDYWLVDGDGVRLPEPYTANQLADIMFGRDNPNHQIAIRLIEGVKNPKPDAGKKWFGDDLAAALDMARFLNAQSAADDVWRIDVSNYAGRRTNTEAQIVLKTRFLAKDGTPTKILWGEPVKSLFHAELRPGEKLERLAKIKQQYGRVDAKQPWIDIRFETIMCPPEGSADAGR